MSLPKDVPLLSHLLAEHGYRTHYIGKAHFQSFLGSLDQSMELVQKGQESLSSFNGPYYGFETVELAPGHVNYGLKGHYGKWVRERVSEQEFLAFQDLHPVGSTQFGGEAYDWDLPFKFHNSMWTSERTVSFLKSHTNQQPFFLAVGFQDPHHPHGVPLDFHDRVHPESIPLPHYIDGELADKPPFFMEARTGTLESSSIRGEFEVAGQGAGFDYRKVSENDARLGRAYYFSMVKIIDIAVGQILDYLDSSGLAENTLLIFTTDHGELLGDHGLWMKGPFHYEELISIPMLWRWPSGLPAELRVEGLVSQVDIVPTILAATGGSFQNLDGVNALPLLRGETKNIRDSVLVETVDDPKGLRSKTIVTSRYKLTYYHGQSYGELIDLEQDPGEIKNLWADPSFQQLKTQLLSLILDTTENNEIPRRAKRHSYA